MPNSNPEKPRNPRKRPRNAAEKAWDRYKVAHYYLKAYSEREIVERVNADLEHLASIVRGHMEEEPADEERRKIVRDIHAPRTVSRSTVQRDIKWLHTTWAESAVFDFDKARAIELERLDRLMNEYYKCIDAERQGFTDSSHVVKSALPRKDALDKLLREYGIERDETKPELVDFYTERRETTRRRNVNPRYLEGIALCIKLRMDLISRVDPGLANRRRPQIKITDITIAPYEPLPEGEPSGGKPPEGGDD